jgi:hypothetical protein
VDLLPLILARDEIRWEESIFPAFSLWRDAHSGRDRSHNKAIDRIADDNRIAVTKQ